MKVLDERTTLSMPPVLQLPNPEIIACSTVVIGFLGDQLTTRIAMNLSWIVEANSLVTWLMMNGLWLPLDLFMATVSISAHFVIQRSFKIENKWLTLSLPLIYGIIKLSTTLWNLLLLFG